VLSGGVSQSEIVSSKRRISFTQHSQFFAGGTKLSSLYYILELIQLLFLKPLMLGRCFIYLYQFNTLRRVVSKFVNWSVAPMNGNFHKSCEGSNCLSAPCFKRNLEAGTKRMFHAVQLTPWRMQSPILLDIAHKAQSSRREDGLSCAKPPKSLQKPTFKIEPLIPTVESL
jgi:hypothetical protein